MWFRKAKQTLDPCQYPGSPAALDGQAAALAVESMAADNVLVQASEGLQELTGPLSRLVPLAKARVDNIQELRHLPAELTGMCATGLRTSAFVDDMSCMSDSLAGMAGKRLAPVIHLVSRCKQRHAWSLHGSHDDYLSASQTGAVQLFARNVQEVADLALIARRVAEEALTPVICAQDFHSTSQSVQSLRLPESELVDDFLGNPDDSIAAPNKAQEVVFGATRRRVPRMLDLDRPAGVGGVQGHESYFRAIAAQRSFFVEPVAEMVSAAMARFSQLTHRQYQPVSSYRMEDAEFVVLAMGAVVDQLCACVDHLRESEGIRVGVLNLTLWRPFPGKELSLLLQGKRAVTVLESTDTPLAEDLPMLAELRSAMAKAVENGATKDDSPAHAGYAVYGKNNPSASIFSAIYGVGTAMPSIAELAAVVKNMLPDGSARRRTYVGVDFSKVSRRYPHLQVLQQSLAASYPDLNQISLSPAAISAPEFQGSLVRLHALAGEGAIAAGNLFARALSSALGLSVRTSSQGGVESGLQRANLDILYDTEQVTGNYQAADVLLVAGASLLQDIPAQAIREGGMLVVSATQDPDQLWRAFPRRVVDLIKNRKLEVHVLDARAIAATTDQGSGHLDQLSIWALLGTALKHAHPEEPSRSAVAQALEDLLKRLLAGDQLTAAEILASVVRGGDESRKLDWQEWKDETRGPETERKAPWTAESGSSAVEDLFDPTRFWHSVGFLFDSGDQDHALIDPFLATGVMPARSSAHRDMSSYRISLPRWLAENCTACGLCWSHCPDSALPPTVQSVESLLETGVRLCKADGQAMTQLTRIAGHLATQVYKLVSKDELKQYTKAGPLLAEAFQQLTRKMGLEGEALNAITADFDHLHQRLERMPIARSERYFDSAGKGEGKLLSLAVNPVNCKACGLCVAVCPDGAMTWEKQSPERIQRSSENVALQLQMPEVSAAQIEQFIREDDLDSEMSRLLNRSSYMSMVGGDSALPGHPGKTAVHLVTAAVDSVMQARYQAHENYLEDLLQRVTTGIQDQLSGVLKISDFDSFANRLRALDKARLDGEDIANALGKDSLAGNLDTGRMERLNSLMFDLEEQLASYQAGRAKMVLALQQGGVTLWSGCYPDNPHANPWLSHDRGEAPALAEGLFQGMSRRLTRELAICRLAEIEIKGDFDRARHAGLETSLDWSDLDQDEQSLMAPVVMVAEAEGAHWDDISRILASDLPITMVLLDSHGITLDAGEAARCAVTYANQAVDQGSSFVLQASTGSPGHLIRGVVNSLKSHGPSLLRVYTPDTMANGLSGEEVAEDASLALRSRAVPLFSYDPANGESPLSIEGNPEPDADWAENTFEVRDGSGVTETVKVVLTVADWAVHQLRFKKHFTLLRKGQLSDDMRPLSAYLNMDEKSRSGLAAYICLQDSGKKKIYAKVSSAMVHACEQALSQWQVLKARATSSGSAPCADQQTAVVVPGQAPQAAPEPLLQDQEILVERLLALCGYSSDPAYFKQSLREFLGNSAKKNQDGADNVQH